MCTCSSNINKWIKNVLENFSLQQYTIKCVGNPGKCAGYIGEVVFIKVIGKNDKSETQEINFAVKSGTQDMVVRNLVPIRTAFESEIIFYTKIFPKFIEFQQQKGVKDIFNSVPKCYKTFIEANREALVLENLRQSGYELHNRYKPMNLQHLSLILKEYGRFHALSFALKDQRAEEFFKIIQDKRDALRELVFCSSLFLQNFTNAFNKFRQVLIDFKEFALLEKFDKLKIDAKESFETLFNIDDPKFVIIHGDAWNNNFMFNYENENRETPCKVSFLDWQMTRLGSPVYDLSFFLYTCSSEEVLLNHHEDLLQIYFASLSIFIKELGSDPTKLFSYAELKEHWKKYSLFGLLFAPSLLKVTLRDENEEFDIKDMAAGDPSSVGTNNEYYSKRMFYVIKHYLQQVNIN